MFEPMIDAHGAAELTGKTSKYIHALANRGFLDSTNIDKVIYFKTSDIEKFKQKQNILNQLEEKVMDFFLLIKEGMPFEEVKKHDKSIDLTYFKIAFNHYNEQSRWQFRDNKEISKDAIKRKELMYRLKINKPIAISRLASEEKFETYSVGLENWYSLSSIKEYLGHRMARPLYTSPQVMKMMKRNEPSITVKKINEIAKRKYVGMKFRVVVPKSKNLFDFKDIERLKRLFKEHLKRNGNR